MGGVPFSDHTFAEGADLACKESFTRYQMVKLALELFPRIGIGKTFVHVGLAKHGLPSVLWTYYP